MFLLATAICLGTQAVARFVREASVAKSIEEDRDVHKVAVWLTKDEFEVLSKTEDPHTCGTLLANAKYRRDKAGKVLEVTGDR